MVGGAHCCVTGCWSTVGCYASHYSLGVGRAAVMRCGVVQVLGQQDECMQWWS